MQALRNALAAFVSRTMAIAGGVIGCVLIVGLALPAALLFAPQKLRDYAYRELAYRVIADEATKGAASNLQAAESLLAYVSGHETAPSTAQVVDDTVFNDLVRGIGFCDQQAWGLSTLLAKKNIPATLLMLRGRQQVSQHSVATVFVNGKWRVLDPYHHFSFVMPSGDPATFEDLQRDPRLIRLTNPKLDALERYKRGFADYYAGLYEPRFPPDKWGSPTDSRNLIRAVITRVVDGYVGLFGDRFVHAYQDLSLRRRLSPAPDGDLFLRGRHYDLFFRRDAAIAAYQRVLREYPASPYAEDALYFLGKAYGDQHQWKAAGQAFDELLARIGPRARWADTAHYFNGLANEAEQNYAKAAREYLASASAEQTDSAVRLSAMGADK
jgi:tetratricopeptide (TPR) repeat protein